MRMGLLIEMASKAWRVVTFTLVLNVLRMLTRFGKLQKNFEVKDEEMRLRSQ
jgi:hypothetical protein